MYSIHVTYFGLFLHLPLRFLHFFHSFFCRRYGSCFIFVQYTQVLPSRPNPEVCYNAEEIRNG